jgi:membrane glycosyltransferase
MDALNGTSMTESQLRVAALWRRALFFSLTFGTALYGADVMFDILKANGLSLLESMSLVLFFVLFTWITGAFWTAVAGFVIRLKGRDPAVIHQDDVAGWPLRTRTALVMPIYNEDAGRVAAGIDVIWRSLQAQEDQGAFDLFILSDTRKPEIAAAEEAAWRALVARHGAAGRIFYRRRELNTSRKAGNIADFVRKWGGAYECMVVLDADSIMSGKTLVALARLMEKNPNVGIIQALPQPAGRDTLFARLVQFAARLNGPMLSTGLAFWQLGESNYWGHNAILRVRAFAHHCALPHLPGKAPLGGEILSHDFVEAALMRRAGYKAWLLADIDGSWEEVPSNIIDFAARDRRWAQGNLQHTKLLRARGLHWLNRLHMVTGILSYATSPVWLAVLVISSIVVCLAAIQGFQYFQPGAYTLFPDWPESRIDEIASLLTLTFAVLLLPKLLGFILAVSDPVTRRGFGGARRLFASLMVEQVFSMLLAPAMMVFHATFVLSTLAGTPVVWDAQERGDRGVTFLQAFRRHRWQLLLGVAWGALILAFAPSYIYWMLPVLIGLLLAIPLTVYTSRADLGRRFRDHGLLLTPEETQTPAELIELAQLQLQPSIAELGAQGAQVSAAALAPRLPATAPMQMEAEPLRNITLRDGLRKFAAVAHALPEHTFDPKAMPSRH